MIRALMFTLALMMIAPAARAQDSLPAMPDALQALADRGAQMRYLGKMHGMDGWIAIYQGQESYYYVTPDGQGFLMGLMFDKEGNMVTVNQVADLQKQGGDVLDFLAAQPPAPSMDAAREQTSEAFTYKSPAQRMFAEVEASNTVTLGDADAPVIYSFMDPQCPHCHDFMEDLRARYIDKGLIQLKVIPVGFNEQSLAQSAFLLAAPDAAERWYKHLDGDESALLAKTAMSTQGVQRNLAIMQAWKFDATPTSVYKSRSGEIKIIRGRAKDMAAVLTDLPAKR